MVFIACYHPLVLRNFGLKENGKKNLRFVKGFNGDYENYRDKDEFVLIPCGQCIGCRLDYAKQWAERCCLEASYYSENMFLTLTYDDDHVPTKCSKKDFQLFIKRLRNHFKDREIRFFGCCERGSKTLRPHMHIIIFNAKFNDMKKLYKSGDNWLFTSDTLNKLWSYGFTTIGEADYSSINYTARYIMKKIKGTKTDEFLLMSRKPGIGLRYLDENIDKLKENQLIYFPFNDTKKQTNLCRYFKTKMLEYGVISDNDLILDRMYSKIDSDKQVYGIDKQWKLNNLKEDLKKEQIKALKRGL